MLPVPPQLPRLLVAGVVALGSIPALSADMIIDNFTAATNDRFFDGDSPDEFFLRDFDLSGVGRASNGNWATLISSNVIIGANHVKPAGSVFFYADNNPSSTPIELAITTDAQRISDTDFWVARLATDAPVSLQIYEYAATPITTSAELLLSPYFNELVYMTGRSPTSQTSSRDQAFGTNITSGFVGDSTAAGLGSVDAFRLEYDSPGGTIYESFLQGGDSGAPLLFDNGNGGLTLLGVNSFIATSNPGGDPIASFVSYTGNDATEISAFIAQAAVPEPVATAMILALGLATLVIIRQGSPQN